MRNGLTPACALSETITSSAEPLFEITHSGWYWQFKPLDTKPLDTKPPQILKSRSLAGAALPLPSEFNIDPNDREIRWGNLPGPQDVWLRIAETNYVFHFPFAGTPCFLLNLDRPIDASVTLKRDDGTTYTWPGGVGPSRSVVAFSAIYYAMLIYAPRQIAEREGGVVEWLLRYATFAVSIALGIGWLSVITA